LVVGPAETFSYGKTGRWNFFNQKLLPKPVKARALDLSTQPFQRALITPNDFDIAIVKVKISQQV
jgi:hypothetical protein